VLQLIEGKEGGVVVGSDEGEKVRVLVFPGETSEGGGEGGIEPVIKICEGRKEGREERFKRN